MKPARPTAKVTPLPLPGPFLPPEPIGTSAKPILFSQGPDPLLTKDRDHFLKIVKKMWDTYDQDSNGLLDLDEMVQILTDAAKEIGAPPLGPNEISEIMEK